MNVEDKILQAYHSLTSTGKEPTREELAKASGLSYRIIRRWVPKLIKSGKWPGKVNAKYTLSRQIKREIANLKKNHTYLEIVSLLKEKYDLLVDISTVKRIYSQYKVKETCNYKSMTPREILERFQDRGEHIGRRKFAKYTGMSLHHARIAMKEYIPEQSDFEFNHYDRVYEEAMREFRTRHSPYKTWGTPVKELINDTL